MALSEILSISATGFIVVLIVLILLAVIIVMLSKVIRAIEGRANKVVETTKETSVVEKVASPTPVSAPVETVAPTPVQYSNGVMLYKTDYKTAASIMAIVSHESGIPLERLAFSSIKLDDSLELYKTDFKTAASIMAIISHQTEIPLQRLVFKSIRLCDTPELYKTDEETAAIWMYAIAFELLQKGLYGKSRKYANQICYVTREFLADRFCFWHHAMRKLVPEIYTDYLLRQLEFESFESIIEIIVLNAALIRHEYVPVLYSSLKQGERWDEYSVRL